MSSNTPKSAPRRPNIPELSCVLIDRFDLPRIDRRVQIECITCGKDFLEGDEYPCLAEMLKQKPLTNGNTRRKEIIKEVSNCVLRDRQSSYGDAEDNFQDIAFRWNNYLNRRFNLPLNVMITPQDVAIMMADLKITRAASNPDHLDNLIDGAGYFVCAGGIAKKRSENS